jgi:hypothetical protein
MLDVVPAAQVSFSLASEFCECERKKRVDLHGDDCPEYDTASP